MKKIYYFQFNGDIESCEALKSMFKDNWSFSSFKQEDGFSFIILEKYIN